MNFDHIDFTTVTPAERAHIDYAHTEFYKPESVQAAAAILARWRAEEEFEAMTCAKH